MENKKLGTVEINPHALTVIANIAASEVEGVSKLLGRKLYSRGVDLEFAGEELLIDVYCNLKSGYSVAKVARKIQENVKNSIFNMTEINTKSVNVNILGIDF
ncbi:Asp23/Gls24 family envelope stress response protein [Gemella cuniculi]|uniref:Asp23/Gls24 family envelope stress response protein n=1 Tax=Gemella cuniculi TaxID=150240 RepID=UPI00040C312B|nr:Asp23/Gls24 family envelope stress response protein [Gemella cuniculi]